LLVVIGDAHIRFTARPDGDLARSVDRSLTSDALVPIDTRVEPEVYERRGAVCPLPWTWLHQVHGSRVVTVAAPGDAVGEAADAAVAAVSGCALAVLTADCAPIALLAPDEGIIGAVHAGWRGALAGVVENAVDAMRDLGARSISAVIGPCIGPECYEFGERDLDTVAERLGDDVRGTTKEGRPALDLSRAVRAALRECGVEDVRALGICTACSTEHFSHRARGERQRQAMVVWR
jgi:YfiH family protein